MLNNLFMNPRPLLLKTITLITKKDIHIFPNNLHCSSGFISCFGFIACNFLDRFENIVSLVYFIEIVKNKIKVDSLRIIWVLYYRSILQNVNVILVYVEKLYSMEMILHFLISSAIVNFSYDITVGTFRL